jgi:3-oxoacyl-[acyl-carrier protein] reductase
MVKVFASDGASIAAIVHEKPLDPELACVAGVRTYTCDVADRDAVHATFDRISADLRGIDALVHTAAVEEVVPAAEIDPPRLDRMLSVNVGGTIYTNQAAYVHMRRTGGGSIVNFHSIAGIRGFPLLGHYAASKAGMAGWTRVAAMEWGAENVRVNAIAPVMLTPMARNYRAGLTPDELERELDSYRQLIHLNGSDFGDAAEHIGPVVQFLTSDGAKFITGQTIPVDGGWVKVGS